MKPRAPQKTIAYELIDMDGCCIPSSLPEGTSFEEAVIQRNKTFLDNLVKKYSSGQFKKIIFGFITNRQSFSTDKNHGLSCLTVLPIFQSYIQSKLGYEVALDPFWTADIYANPRNGGENKEPGESYKLALNAHFNKEEKIDRDLHAKEIGDHSKITLLYAHAHRAAIFNPKEKIEINVTDDSSTLLRGLYEFAKGLPHLFPENVIFNFVQYKGEGIGEPFKSSVQGTGKKDIYYYWTVRRLWSTGYYFGSGESGDKNIQTAEKLNEAHEKNHYFKPGHNDDMSVNLTAEELKMILHFRKNECPKLPRCGLVSNFTTAKKLHNEKLLPESCLVGGLKYEDVIYKPEVEDKKNESQSITSAGSHGLFETITLTKDGRKEQPQDNKTELNSKKDNCLVM